VVAKAAGYDRLKRREEAGETQRTTEQERRVMALQVRLIVKTVGQKRKHAKQKRGRKGLRMPAFDEARLEGFYTRVVR
jgi:hypothetical protein